MPPKAKPPDDTPPPIRKLRRKPRIRIMPKFENRPMPGRPRMYEPAYCPRAYKLALLGLTDVEIAEQWGITVDKFYQWQADEPELREALMRGKVPADAEVAASHYQRALGYEREAVKIFMPAGADAPVYAPYMEHYPGDVGAQKNWLNNRQRGRWQDRQSIDVGGTLDVRLAAMTPDERAADAVALVQRIQARLAASRLIEGESDNVTDAEEDGEPSVTSVTAVPKGVTPPEGRATPPAPLSVAPAIESVTSSVILPSPAEPVTRSAAAERQRRKRERDRQKKQQP
jgi:hypothetical protein